MSRRPFALRMEHASEDVEQASLFCWLRAKRWQGRPLADYAFSVPNGGHRHLLEAVKLKRTGTKAGVPDVVLPIPASGYHGLFVELKANGGRLSEAQSAFHDVLRSQGYRVVVCFGWHAAADAIDEYLTGVCRG